MSTAMMELGFPVAIVETMEDAGRWPDLTRLRARRPDVLRAVAWMLAHDVPVRDISSALSVSPCTVQAVADDPALGVAVVTQKASLTARMRLAFRLGIERVLADLERGTKMPVFDLKLLHDMIQLADGGATSRMEHVIVHESPHAAALLKLLESAHGMGLEHGETSALADPEFGGCVGANAAAVGRQAQENPLIVRELDANDVVLLSNSPGPSPEFQQGGGGVEAVPHP